MANTATVIVKTWNVGDNFLASDINTIVKGTVNDLVEDNDKYHTSLIKATDITSTVNENPSNQSTIDGSRSFSYGSGNDITANDAVAFGTNVTVEGNNSAGFGNSVRVSGNDSLGFGDEVSADSNYSFVGGKGTSVDGSSSFAFGNRATNLGTRCYILGSRSKINNGISNTCVIGDSITANLSNVTYVNNLIISDLLNDNNFETYTLVIDGNNQLKKTPRNWYGEEYGFVQSMGESNTTSTSPVQKLTLNVPTGVVPGDYKVVVSYTWYQSSPSQDFRAEVRLDSSQIYYHSQEVQQNGTTQKIPATKPIFISISDNSVSHSIVLNYWSENSGARSYIKDATLEYILVAPY